MSLESVIQNDWVDEPGVMQACLHIWKALAARSYQFDHYTFAELAQLSGESDESLIAKAILYLANPKIRVLKTCMMYEFDGAFFELPADEIAHYSKGEAVIHPEFGEPIPESEILLCFIPGPRLLNKEGL